ncbi:MAG: methyltransferase domain-containing protein [Bacteroidales bacterium]|nr:methyltransferase domain-containing protein [Bacteroidales bacterium]
MAEKLYKESKVELNPVIARHYDRIMNFISAGRYERFIRKAIGDMQINPGDHILDMGCGTGKNAALMAEYLGDTGRITGVDLSPIMEKQFLKKHEPDDRIEFRRQRVDVPFDLDKKYDRVLISFVIHGFPHEVREAILKNAHTHLKPGGKLTILDFAEFNMADMPWHHRTIFKTVECVYAFDFIERNWKAILKEFNFTRPEEKHYFLNYARLLTAIKNGN